MSGSWRDGELLAFDLETTGVNKFTDVPVSFALITLKNGEVIEERTSIVNPGRPIPPGAARVHGISDERAIAEGMALEDAVEVVVGVLVDASQRGVPVVGFNLSYDLTMTDSCARNFKKAGLRELGWQGPVLDPLVMDRALDRYRKGKRTLGDICDVYGVVNAAAHDAGGDATASAFVLLAMAEKYPEVADSDPAALFEQQAQWHREWAEHYDEWSRGAGRRGIDPGDFVWPISEGR
jgi:DNA polymerase III subunit epsilon